MRALREDRGLLLLPVKCLVVNVKLGELLTPLYLFAYLNFAAAVGEEAMSAILDTTS